MLDHVEVHVDLDGEANRVGTLHREPRRGYEAVGFTYAGNWLQRDDAFSLEPALRLSPGGFAPRGGRRLFGSLGDSAPDAWGRQLLRRAERLEARKQQRHTRTLHELDYLLGVADIARTGALRFRRSSTEPFQSDRPQAVPSVVHLRRLLEATDRTIREEETEEDLRLILAPGSSLGGARPKAVVADAVGAMAIAKFPKESDEYSLERWEAVALRLARCAGIDAAECELVDVAGRATAVIKRFDRHGANRIPFLSAMSMLDRVDGERSSYLELVDAIAQYGARAKHDSLELFRRMAFNVLVSNVDDHLRNHAFLWTGVKGWALSPAFDLNPTPADVRERRLTSNIDLEDGTCDIRLVLDVAEYFSLSHEEARTIVREVARATRDWATVAKSLGAGDREIERMESAFEHGDLELAITL